MKKKAIKGITLIETLLVMVIATMLLALALQQYQFYKRDSDIKQVAANVNNLFLGMSRYYYGNCSPPYSYDQNPCGTTARSPLVVCPATATTVQNPVVINITTDLINNGFLQAADLTIQSIIDQKNLNDAQSSPLNGYTLQYNLFYKSDGNIPTRQFCQNNVCTTVSFTILWKMQIGVKLTLTASTSADIYKNILEADCVSDYADKCGSTPPPSGGQTPAPAPKYLIFTRFPGHLTPNAFSIYWQMNPMVRAFKQEYESQPDWYLATNSSAPKYYYCGHY